MAAEHSPSSGLPSHRAARSADPVVAMAHPDDFPDAWLPEAPSALPDQRPTDEHRWATNAWDASDDARQDVAADAALPALAAAAAGKSADPALDVRAPDALIRSGPQVAQALEAAPCTPAVVPSAEQSCAAAEQRVRRASPQSPPWVLPAELEVRPAVQPPLRW